MTLNDSTLIEINQFNDAENKILKPIHIVITNQSARGGFHISDIR